MNRTVSKQSLVLPTFLYIGAEKAGSTWIYEALSEHPEVFVTFVKDIDFFNKHYDRGMEWYASFFAKAGSAKAIGELSHDYFLEASSAHRIHEFLPEAKLVCCLREPVERTVSAYLFCRNMDLSRKSDLEHFMFRPDTLKHNDYYQNLAPFYDLFPRENLRVLFFDQLKRDSKRFIQEIYDFIGVDASLEPSVIDKKVLPATEPRWDAFAHLVYRGAALAREKGLLRTLGRAKRSSVVRHLLYKKVKQRPVVPEALKVRLRSHFKDYARLSELIGKPVPESWRAD